ncbi:MAG: 50S ribosomal protein L1 [Candidatus Omnitrophica bacterium CG11_big_fil_rev_8_21_14_0_20_45_26]|uniref:Large ribosomal subunit protein uL1 n=1 Tax=Candidatus Abzuiibacterium crystallinum TaxID=1974748 RepID=A0A2H0LNE5_9BACT|nr:MAG: 50S ribosomal protein L1 [Candidatus Omnitrophica bacterium CG11_big_fil_rev_8_21_14_0_20_45_26]PIW63431.1 MAG: 50S ribosomal protein L1 [Candidatus Omnitrophica bacterium CG12_big_fil_rev_8_21_14_0_65_45_16]
MKTASKRHQANVKTKEIGKVYSIAEAVKLLKQQQNRKFDETVELHFQLGLKLDGSEAGVRSSVGLPHGTGKKVRVICFCKGEGARGAQAAGADEVGGEELVEKVLKGWMEFDSVVAHPEMMREVSKLGRVLGPRGLMPTPKTGTVTMNVAQAIKEIKAGRAEFKSDKTGGIHVACGKLSFAEPALVENATTVLQAIVKAKPASAKGDYVRRVFMSSTQGLGLPIEVSSFLRTETEE